MNPGERIYLIDDPEHGVEAETRQDVIDRHVGRYWRAVQLADRTGGRWLDIACGSGYGSRLIADLAIPDTVVGFDTSASAIEHAVRFYSGRRCHFVASVFSILGDFDVVISIETLEHMDWDMQALFINGIAGWTERSGVFVLACPLGNGRNVRNPFHVHEPTQAQLADLLDTYFDSVHIEMESYVSTSGPAVQAWAVCREPR